MKFKLWLILAVIISASSCDDGDLIVTSFDFEDQELELCDAATNLVFFKINNESQESIALSITATSEIFLENEIADINLSALNFVTYRKFNNDIDASYFCNSVPPVSPQVSIEYLAESGIAVLDNTLILDDNDGVPEEFELGPIPQIPQDTDTDGIPDYYDFDDDGDNVPTRLELSTNDNDGDGDPFTPEIDTDMDGIPNYLDNDDDGDGIFTRNESTDGDLDPTNDLNDPNKNDVPDYLNDAIMITGSNNEEYILHTVNRNASVALILSDLVLTNENETIVQETLNMGAINNVINDTAILAPKFN